MQAEGRERLHNMSKVKVQVKVQVTSLLYTVQVTIFRYTYIKAGSMHIICRRGTRDSRNISTS